MWRAIEITLDMVMCLRSRGKFCICKLHDPRQIIISQFPHLSNETKNTYHTSLFKGSNERKSGKHLLTARYYTHEVTRLEWVFFNILYKPGTKYCHSWPQWGYSLNIGVCFYTSSQNDSSRATQYQKLECCFTVHLLNFYLKHKI